MPPDPTKPPEETGLVIQRGAGLVALAAGGSPALSEIINRSLVHIRTSKALSTRQRIAGEECKFEIAPGVKIVMCWIPPGEFLMGSPVDEDDRFEIETQHQVRITREFWLAKTQTTQEQWHAVMGGNPSEFIGAKNPVENVSWNDCQDFIEKLWKKVPDKAFRLPTEAEWEYACRAGTTGKYAGDLDDMAWYSSNADSKTHPVGGKKPNAWGLYDMHGNVFEWCADWVGDYPEDAATDPTGPNIGSIRMYRGGSWRYGGWDCRSVNRDGSPPGVRDGSIGFRVAAVLASARRAVDVA